MRRWIWLAMALVVTGGAVQTPRDHTAEEGAALFVVACLPGTGTPAKLRNWASRHQLPALPPEAAASFLGGQPGQVYMATRLGAMMALLSYNNGACGVNIESVDFNRAVSQLSGDMQRRGFDLSPVAAEAKPGVKTAVAFKALTAKRGWLITATMHPHEDAPGVLPEVDLLATAGS